MAVSRWLIAALVAAYILLRALPLIMMTAYRLHGGVPADAPTELATYFLHMPWVVIAVSWLAIVTYIVAVTLSVLRRAGAKRTFSAALALDLGAWIYARAATTYTDVFSPTEQAVDAFAFLIIVFVIALMIIERRRDSLT